MKTLLLILIMGLTTTMLKAQDTQADERLSVQTYKQVAKRSTDDFRELYNLDLLQYNKIFLINEQFFKEVVELSQKSDSASFRVNGIAELVRKREVELIEVFTTAQWVKFLENKSTFENRKRLLKQKVFNSERNIKN